MSKISSYGIVSPPVAGDLVIGTNTIDSNKTKNFRVEDIAALAATPTLSEVLTAGNTATNNLTLIGSLSITGTSVFNGSTQFGPTGTTDFGHLVEFGAITLEGTVRDGFSSVGTAGQVLSSTGTGVQWVDDSAPIPTLAEVVTAGNTSSTAISLTGDVTLGTTGTSTIQANGSLFINTLLVDINDSSGTPGQVLTSTSSGPTWGDATDVNVLSSSTSVDQSLVASNLRKQVDFTDGVTIFNPYFNLASDGTITALTAGTYSISINLNSGSLLVGLGDQHVDFFYSVDLNGSQIQNTYQNTVYFDAQSSDPAQTLSIQFLQTLAANDTLKVYQAASLYIASGSNSMQSGLVAKTIGVTGMGGVPSAAINIDRV